MSCRIYRILIVDQDSVSRENTARLLRSLGYTDIFEAGDGSEAIARCERINFDAILTEIDTQPLGGLGFLAALRGADSPLIPTRNTTTPLLVLTSQTRPDIIRRARQLGAAAYLLKPVCAARLARDRVRKSCRGCILILFAADDASRSGGRGSSYRARGGSP